MTEKEIWDKAYKRIFELYGNMPDLRIVSRFFIDMRLANTFTILPSFDVKPRAPESN